MGDRKVRDINGLSIIRVIATLMIVTVHFGQSLPVPNALKLLAQFGQTGVCIFFILTGYFTQQSLEKKDNVKKYYIGRIIRIIPVYYCVILFNILASLIIGSYPTVDSLHIGWIRFFTFTNGILPSNDYAYWNNGAALWTMSGFGIFYLLAPLFYKHMNSASKRVVILAGGVVVAYISKELFVALSNNESIYAQSYGYLATHSVFFVFFEMLLGMYLYKTDKTKGRSLLPIVLIWLIGEVYDESWFSYAAVYGLVIFILSALSEIDIKSGSLCSKIIMLIDEYSYSIYLGHTTVMFTFSRLRNVIGYSNITLMILDFVGSVIFIWFLHNVVENKVGGYLRKHLLATDI